MRRFLHILWKEWLKDEVARHAAAVAYFSIFSVPALLLTVVTIGGMFVDEAELSLEVFRRMTQYVGEGLATFLRNTIENIDQRGGENVWISLVSFLIFVLISSRIFRELQITLDKILNIKPERHATVGRIIRSYVVSLLLLLLMILLLIIFVGSAALLAILGEHVTHVLDIRIDTWQFINTLTTYTTVPILFFLLYLFLPSKRQPIVPILLGSIVGGVLFVLGTFVLTWYITTSNLGEAYGVASSLLILLFWIFYSVTIFLLGGEVIDVYRQLRKPRKGKVRKLLPFIG